MRTLLAAVLLAAIIIAGVAILVPLVARPVIVAAVQGASPFGDQPLDIEVDCNVFGLLTGTVDRIHVRGTNLQRGDVTVGAVEVTVVDVATSGRAFAGVDGELAMVQVPVDGAGTITIDELRLEGSSSRTAAVATIDRASALRMLEGAFADAGLDVSGLALGTGTVVFEAFGARVEVPLGVEDGAIVVVDPFGAGSLEVVKAGEGDGWQFSGVVVTPGGLTIDASLDAERLLTGG